MLHDFADDSSGFAELAAALDRPRRDQPPELASALSDYGDVMAVEGRETTAAVALQVHAQITVRALARIVERLSAVQGRKNLVWLMPTGYVPPVAVTQMLHQSNIVLFPVMVRLVGNADVEDVKCGGNEVKKTLPIMERVAADAGGQAFYDGMDLTTAVRVAEEERDPRSGYVLGFYPQEDKLDGKFHRLIVKLKDPKLAKAYDVRCRVGYFATKVAPQVAPELSDRTLLTGPVDATEIGLSGSLHPDAAHPGMRQLQLTVDLRDVHRALTPAASLEIWMPSSRSPRPNLACASTCRSTFPQPYLRKLSRPAISSPLAASARSPGSCGPSSATHVPAQPAPAPRCSRRVNGRPTLSFSGA